MTSKPTGGQRPHATRRGGPNLLRFVVDEVQAPWVPIVLAIIGSGVAETMLLAIINLAAGGIYLGDRPWLLAAVFTGVFALLMGAQWFALTRTSDAVEHAIAGAKIRVGGKLLPSSLRSIEARGGVDAYTPLTRVGVISQGTVLLVSSAQAVSGLLFIAIYLALLSPANLLVICAILAVCLPFFSGAYRATRGLLREAAGIEARLFHRFTELIQGFSEVVLDRQLSDGLMAELDQTSTAALQRKTEVAERQVRDINFTSSMLSLLLFAVVFVVPLALGESSINIHALATAVLFLFGPVGELAITIPVLGRFDAAVSDLYALEDGLDRAAGESDGLSPVQGLTEFQHIELADVGFHYSERGEQGAFGVGPLNLTLHRGEMLFIVGGNGSGKSTLLKLLTGLYPPDSGRVLLDGRSVGEAERPAYRTLFAAVFTDFHLFPRLHGRPGIDPDMVNRRLAELGLGNKTRFGADGFHDLELSTGQRKRIALLAATLKERPILVLDELAADQDPAFRRHFYEEMLPQFKARGLTLVCVTHDDQFFHVADRVLMMREGRFVPAGNQPEPGASPWT
jgi:putative ATP-binding cassette transporter